MTSKYQIEIKLNKVPLIKIIREISKLEKLNHKRVEKILRKYPSKNGVFSKGNVIKAYKELKSEIKLSQKQENRFYANIQMKNVRSISGVTPVTVLTKPFPCPGKCIFCPNDVRMPKSYLSDEPGAQRAEANRFDPYLQTHNRLAALNNIGHPIDKIELIILGGTWSSYPESYQVWFVKRCFDAMNDFYDTNKDLIKPKIQQPYYSKKLKLIKGDSIEKTYNQVVSLALKRQKSTKETATWEELEKTHKINEQSVVRCIGLVIETRPDEISEDEVIRIRKLGATKVQLGIQSLNNKVLKMNKRGHDSKKTAEAFALLRQAGFKIHVHYMPNLYGSSPKIDTQDYKKIFRSKLYRPDEIKIYPCSLIESAELVKYYKSGKWKPYTDKELENVLTRSLLETPQYCRITRMIRDIPSTDIIVGNKKTNFRQIAENKLRKQNKEVVEIRSREIKNSKVKRSDLKMKIVKYKTQVSTELFLQYVDKNNKIAGFLRLSLPTKKNYIEELELAAIIREIHVYGQAVNIGSKESGKAQHIGLGKNLIEKAKEIAKENQYQKLAVISSVGTREYYRKRGFVDGKLYQALYF